MIAICLALLASLLWLILTPFSLTITLLFSGISALFIAGLSFNKQFRFTSSSILATLILAHVILLPSLKSYQSAINYLPIEDNFQIKILQNNPEYVSFKARITYSTHADLIGKSIYIYDRKTPRENFILHEIYKVKLKLRSLNSSQTFTNKSQRLHYLSQNLVANATPTSDFLRIEKTDILTRIRLKIHNHFTELNYPKSSYLSALSVGITDQFEEKDWDILRKTGTIHLISISGLHLTFIALWLFIFIRTLCGLLMIQRIEPYKVAALLAISIATLYALLAGFTLPTQRSLVMFIVAMAMFFTSYSILSLPSLALAAFIILIFSPLAILTVGFWLSFTAVAVLILISKYKFRPLYLLLFTQLSVSFIVMPFTASYFGEISLISPIANFFAIPWTTIYILPSLLLGVLFLPLSESIANAFFLFSHHCLEFMLWILAKIDLFPYASIKIFKISFISAVMITSLILLIISPLKRSIRSILMVATLILGIISIFPKNIPNTLHVLPVGEGLSVFLHTNEVNILFDTGNYFRQFDAGKKIIIPNLKALNISKLDYLLLSKNNQQHTGGTRTVLTHFPNTKVIAPPSMQYLINESKRCDQFSLSIGSLSILPFTEIESSCGFLITVDKQNIWLLADITQLEWKRLLNKYPLPDLLLFPNQGRSRDFATDKLLSKDFHLIFSTQKIHPSYQALLQTSNYFNAYDGWIIFDLNKQKISQYVDHKRYWWMKNNDLNSTKQSI